MSNKIDGIQTGKHYTFNFTHRKNVHGIVCEVNLEKNFFVIYDVDSKNYESIPQRRFISFDQRR